MSDYIIQKFPERLVKDARFIRSHDFGKMLLIKKVVMKKGSELKRIFYRQKML